MKLATVRDHGTTTAVRIDGDAAVVLDFPDVGALLEDPHWPQVAAQSTGTTMNAATLDYAPVVPRPSKIICVGLNYRAHILETGTELPRYPTLFAKFATALIGAYDDIVLPPESTQIDWEAELALIMGTPVRHADEAAARAAIAGYTVLNDVSARDWQNRTLQWLQGKTFEALTPVGPYLLTGDEFDPGGHRITCTVGAEVMQDSNTADLLFDPIGLIRYISTITSLAPGDLIATGTPGGIGGARTPPRFLGAGAVVTTEIEGLGRLRNVCRSPE